MVRACRLWLLLLSISAAASLHAQATPMDVQTLRPNLFLLTGGNANTLVFVRSKDVVIIDTKGPRPWWGRAIADQVKALTALPITTIINTSVSGSSVGGNPYFATHGIEIIAQEYAAVDMRKMTSMFTQPTGGGLPTRTFRDHLTIGTGPDTLELYYFGPAHSRSDIFVLIPALHVLDTGAAFGGDYLPALDRLDGGDGVAYPDTLTKALPLTRNVEVIITGGSGVANPKDLVVYRDFMRDFLANAQRAKKAGLTPEAAAKAWRVPERYVGFTAQPVLVLGDLQWIYQQLR